MLIDVIDLVFILDVVVVVVAGNAVVVVGNVVVVVGNVVVVVVMMSKNSFGV